MRLFLRILFLTLCFAGIADGESAVTLHSLLNNLTNLDTLYVPPAYATGMFSSYDREKGNLDNTGFIRREGDWFVIAEAEGPGAITRIWSSFPSRHDPDLSG